jgi:hypothetical protein
MIAKFKKLLILSSTILVLNATVFCVSDKDSQQKQAPNTKTVEPTKEPDVNSAPQRLESDNMNVLNRFLLIIPINALRLEKAYADAEKALKYFSDQNTATTKSLSPEEELKMVLEFRDKLLKPIASFFSNLYKHQFLLKPLVEEIFKVTKFATTKEELNKAIMIQFFNVDEKTAQTYFNDIMSTKEMFLKTCKEFEVLFGVVNVSLSNDVIKKVTELKQKAIDAKKKQLANQKTKEPTNQKLDPKKKPEQK